MDTEATVAQSIRMIEAGCELVRITAPGVKDALHLQVIKDELTRQGFKTPLVADIHYQPKAAEAAARIVEKVRINPGNYTDRKKGKVYFTEEEYQAETDKIKERIKPLIQICKEHNTAIRIGSNHGSLSERILFRYGDTPEGMVESAMEFVRICSDLDFHNLVLSMKASNVKVMVQANRLLVKQMMKEGFDYPVHLGVTEAGDAEDGRIKSAAGIGPLLLEGIGDTIRVSLTEDPEFEIPVAKEIVQSLPTEKSGSRPFRTELNSKFKVPVVILSKTNPKADFTEIAKDFMPDYVFGKENQLKPHRETVNNKPDLSFIEIFTVDDLKKIAIEDVLVFNLNTISHPAEVNSWFTKLKENKIDKPVIIKKDFSDKNNDGLLISATIFFSWFLIDDLINGVWIESSTSTPKKLAELSFGILQATRARITKTEYIACPSCGRTLFNIQDTLQKIKKRTSHLKGLKIGVMGCCVNGPGEMADADYGYVGAGKGKVSLYKGQKLIKIGIKEEEAVEALQNLIKDHGDWVER
jgi:(E)-4-hydroxy-3-methylbut-2-enyl-diphosphate synthase